MLSWNNPLDHAVIKKSSLYVILTYYTVKIILTLELSNVDIVINWT